MFKDIKDSMEMTKGQRVGLMLLVIIMGIVITIISLRPAKHFDPIENARIAKEFRAEINSLKTDTVISEPKRNNKKKIKKESATDASEFTLHEVPAIND